MNLRRSLASTAMAGMIVVLGAPNAGFAQDDGWRVGFLSAWVPRRFEGAGNTLRLNAGADRSPIPSEVFFLNDDGSGAFTIGLFAIGDGGGGKLVPLAFADYQLPVTGFANAVTAGAGLALQSGGNHFRLSFALEGLGAYLWGTVGEVGTAGGDVYLEAPDGQTYDVGAQIKINQLVWGGEALAGIEIGRRAGGALRLEGGYRLFSSPTEWRARVSDGTRTSDLPTPAFEGSTPRVRLSGASIRITFLRPL